MSELHSKCASQRIEEMEPVIVEAVEDYENIMRRRGLASLALNHAELVPVKSFEQIKQDYDSEVKRWADHGIDITPMMNSLFMLNGLTEENLPNYSTELGLAYKRFDSEGLGLWVPRWNASEQQHWPTISKLAEATGAVDYKDEYVPAMTKNMIAGIHPNLKQPEDGFAYLTPQELSTKISHHFLSQMLTGVASDAVAEVTKDEAHHYAFYRKMLAVSAQLHPDETLQAIEKQFSGFAMPGQQGIRGYKSHALRLAAAGVLDNQKTVGMFHDILKAIDLLGLKPVTDEGKEIQEKLSLYIDLTSDKHLEASNADDKIREMVARRKSGVNVGFQAFVIGHTVEVVDGKLEPMAA